MTTTRPAIGGGPIRGIRGSRPSGKVTIEHVAEKAGVSIATVSRVLNGIDKKVSEETIERVRAVITEMGYRPTRVGRALRRLESHLVGMLIPDTTNAFYAAIAHSVEAALRADSTAMILCNTAENPVVQDAYLDEMEGHLARGIALLGAVASPGLERLVSSAAPLVFINRKPPMPGGGPFVGIDNYAAGREIGTHFVERNYQRCAVIHGPAASSASRERFEGFRDGLAAEGVRLEDRSVHEAALTMSAGYSAAVELLDRPPLPRAVFCGNDLIAYGVHRRCREVGLRVPADVALFGFDDNPLNEWLAPWLSTVHVPYEQFGPAAQRVFQRLWDAKPGIRQHQELLPYRLVFRASA
jgi:LacI family transcriptional regulator